MGTTLLSELEQAELVARARLLAATAEADRRVEAARNEAVRIEAGVGDAIEQAVAALQDRYRTEADRDIEEIEAELARLDASNSFGGGMGSGLETAATAVVAAVLAETGA